MVLGDGYFGLKQDRTGNIIIKHKAITPNLKA